MYVLSEALQPCTGTQQMALLVKCWLLGQCVGFGTSAGVIQNGALKEPGFPGKLCQSGKGFLVFNFYLGERQHSKKLNSSV